MKFFQLFTAQPTEDFHTDEFSVKKITKIASANTGNNSNGTGFDWKQFFASTWKKTFFWILVGIAVLVLISFVGNQISAAIFTILPLFFGYGFSYLLRPLISFLNRFFSLKVSKFLVFFLFVVVVLGLVFCVIFVLVIQLDQLYQQFLYGSGSAAFQKQFLKDINTDNTITQLTFNKDLNQPQFVLTYLLDDQPVQIVTPINTTADIYIFILKIISVAPFLQRLLFSAVVWLHKSVDNYKFLNLLFTDFWIWLSLIYLVFFTIIIAAFTLDDNGEFFRKSWHFFTKEQNPTTTEFLKVELKKGYKSWFKALLLVQTYILVFTSFFIFLAGILYYQTSTYLNSILVLGFFMFLCNLIPYFGPAIGFIPIIAIGIVDGIKQGGDSLQHWAPLLIATSGCLLVQFGESAFVSPLVYSQRVKIKPITVIIGLSFFGAVFGVFSMPFAIPVIVFIKIVAETVYKKKWDI